jgi:hypothetical protein
MEARADCPIEEASQFHGLSLGGEGSSPPMISGLAAC